MAVTARTWVTSELGTAAKMNTLRDDILYLDSVAGFNTTQYGSITIADGSATGTATVTSTSARAWVQNLGALRSDAQTATGYTITRTNATTITATRTGTGAGTTITVLFCVVDPRG